MTNIRDIVRTALRDASLRPSEQALSTIRAYHAELRCGGQTIASLRNERTADGFVTSQLEQDSSRIADVVTVQIDQALPLYRLVRALKPAQVVEIGTGAGTSGAMILAALHDNCGGELVTLDGAPDMAALARGLFERLGYGSRVRQVLGLFNDTVPEIAKYVSRVDFAFIDDEHRAEATHRDMEHLGPLLGRDAVLVFDDINWAGSRDAWLEIASRSDCAFSCTLDYRGLARLGLWAKGAPATGYRRRPESFEMTAPYFAGPAWQAVRKVLGKSVSAR